MSVNRELDVTSSVQQLTKKLLLQMIANDKFSGFSILILTIGCVWQIGKGLPNRKDHNLNFGLLFFQKNKKTRFQHSEKFQRNLNQPLKASLAVPPEEWC